MTLTQKRRGAVRHNPRDRWRELLARPTRRRPRALRRDAGRAARAARALAARCSSNSPATPAEAHARALQCGAAPGARERRHLQRLRRSRRAPTGRGSSTCCRWSCRRTNGPASRRRSRSARRCSTRSWSTSTASSACSQEGLLPPALVYGHAGFLRPCRGARRARRRDAAPVRRRPRALARRPAGG